MTEYMVIFWLSSDKNFEFRGFPNYEESVAFAKEKKRNSNLDVIIVKRNDSKYQLMDFGYSTVYKWQNRILNFLSIMIVAIISYLYFKFVNKKT